MIFVVSAAHTYDFGHLEVSIPIGLAAGLRATGRDVEVAWGGSTCEIVGISGSLNDEECRLDSFDWMTPRYLWQYDSAGWASVLQSCGFARGGNLQFPVSWRCTR